jgi:hypothetical protein
MGSTSKFLRQKPMQRTGPPSGDSQARAPEADIHRMTGGSGPAHPKNMHHVVHTKIGDHRQGMHSGPANQSTAPRTRPGMPIHNGRNGGNDAA